jgi:hypothetical protein
MNNNGENMNEKEKLIAALEAIGFKVRMCTERYIDIEMLCGNRDIEANICIDKGIPTVAECIKEWGRDCWFAGESEGETSCYRPM